VRTQAARTLRRETAVNSATHVAAPSPDDAAAWVKRLASGGDAEAGERVFFALTSTCAQCHRVNGRGGAVGPDLSLIARTVSREQLIRSIVTPSEEISPRFQGWEIKTTSGEVLTGLQGHWRTGGAATLITLDGRTIKIGPGQVASFQAMQTSLMPERLAALFSVHELRDLVAYLASRK
jgi:putative heme-binding domain-containing protein